MKGNVTLLQSFPMESFSVDVKFTFTCDVTKARSFACTSLTVNYHLIHMVFTMGSLWGENDTVVLELYFMHT